MTSNDTFPPAQRFPRRLPVVEIDGTDFFRDDRLKEYRNVSNPHDRITFQDFNARARDGEDERP